MRVHRSNRLTAVRKLGVQNGVARISSLEASALRTKDSWDAVPGYHAYICMLYLLLVVKF